MSALHGELPALGFEFAPHGLGRPQATGLFKSKPEDFIVEEILGFEPSGSGEHLFLLLQTDDHNTTYTQKCLARHFAVAKKNVSYSGLKDRRGLTSQWFSVHLPGQDIEPDAEALAKQGIGLLRYQRHNKKLRIGTHQLNGFRITLRGVTDPQSLTARLSVVAEQGVPNYFGAQRFGHNGANLETVLAWADKQALPDARQERSRLLSVLRAWVFNGRLAQRVAEQSWNCWSDRDVIMLAGSQSYFQQNWDSDLQKRFLQGDIHLAGWLPGEQDYGPAGEDLGQLLSLARMSPEPRPWRLLPTNLGYSVQDDRVEIQFQLPKGGYATSLLREVVNLSEPAN